MVNVMRMAPLRRTVTVREGASAVAVDECAAYTEWDVSFGAANVQRLGIRPQHHRHDAAVAGQHACMGGAEEGSAVQHGGAEFFLEHLQWHGDHDRGFLTALAGNVVVAGGQAQNVHEGISQSLWCASWVAAVALGGAWFG